MKTQYPKSFLIHIPGSVKQAHLCCSWNGPFPATVHPLSLGDSGEENMEGASGGGEKAGGGSQKPGENKHDDGI